MGDSADFMTDINGAALEKYLSLPGGVQVTIRADGQYLRRLRGRDKDPDDYA